MRRRLSLDILRYTPGLAVPIVVGTLSTIVFARIASPSELGRFLLISALATSVGTPCGQWLQQSVLRFYPAYASEGQVRSFVRAVALMAVGSGAVASLIVVIALWGGLGGTQTADEEILPAATLAFFAVASAGRAAILQASFALTRYSLLTSLFAILRFALPLALLRGLGPVGALLWGSALAVFASWVILMRQRPAGGWQPGPPWGLQQIARFGREAMSFGLPMTFSEVGVQVLQFSDRYAIAVLLGPAAVGLYGTNYSIAEKLVILVQGPLIYAAHSPIVSAWERGDKAHVASLIRTAMRWLVLLGAPLVAFSLVRGELIAALLLGEAYAPGHVVIPIAAASILLYAASQYGHKTFELGKQTWVITAALLAAAVLNAFAVVGLTLAVGYLGGALGTAVGYAAYASFIFFLSRRSSSLFPWEVPWRTVAVGIASAAVAGVAWSVLAPVRLSGVRELVSLVGSGLAGLAVYGTLLVAVGEVQLPLDLIFARARRARAN